MGGVLKYFNDGCWLIRKTFTAQIPFYTKNHHYTNHQLLRPITKPTTPHNSWHYQIPHRQESN